MIIITGKEGPILPDKIKVDLESIKRETPGFFK